jgi:hypothetical protein
MCGNAAEFILDPWVMMQLPWYPVMFHQWLAAVLSEVLKFEKELVELNHWPIADLMKTPVGQLFQIRAILRRSLYCGFLYLHMQYEYCPDFEMEQSIVSIIMDRVVLLAAPYLRFLLSNNYMRLLMSLKNYLWTEVKNRGPVGPLTRINNMYDAKFDELHYLYSPEFWKSDGKAEKLFGRSAADSMKNSQGTEKEWIEDFLQDAEFKVFLVSYTFELL